MTATQHTDRVSRTLVEAYERWAIDRGARWLRLGVVEVNRRAEAFCGGSISASQRQAGYALGDHSMY